MTAAIAAIMAFVVVLTLPPAPAQLNTSLPVSMVMGAYHVHTSRSDGTGDVEHVAAAAARAGLGFVVLTDHGDATRAPDPPAYRHGVLCIDAVEINTTAGHVVALGLTGASPYPLAGSARDVIEDIHRRGGQAVMAHPDSPGADLRWRGQSTATDGLEWLNADSEWRDERLLTLLGTAVHGLIRGPAAVASVFSRPTFTLARWDSVAVRRATFGLAALDAHANIPWRDRQEPRSATGLPFPSYETMFKALAQVVILPTPLTHEASRDAATVLTALTSGQSYSVVRAFAEPVPMEFTAQQGSAQVTMGGRIRATEPAALHASLPEISGARLMLMGQGRAVATGSRDVNYRTPTSAAVYRVEVTLPGHDMPWIVTNPIVVADAAPTPREEERPGEERTVSLSLAETDWVIEREQASDGTVKREGQELRFTYRLANGTPRGQYAALVSAVPSDLGVERVTFTGRADRPMRLSVQVRTPDRLGGQRWRRSVYLDTTPRVVTVPLEEFDPADGPSTRRPVVARLQSVLFVVDTLNTLTGTGGTVWIRDVALGSRALTSER